MTQHAASKDPETLRPITFEGYQPFRRRLLSRYGAVFQQYPAAALLLDLPLTVFEETGEDRSAWYFGNWTRPRSRRSRFLSGARRFAVRGTSGSCVLDDIRGRFPFVTESLRRAAHSLGWSTLFTELPGGGVIRDAIAVRSHLPVTAAIASCSRTSALLRRISDCGLKHALQSGLLLAELEAAAGDLVQQIRKELEASRVRAIVTIDDAQGDSRLVIRAAAEAGIRTIVVAHGFIVHPCLRSICPPIADVLLVWTPQQRDAICKVIDPDLADRIRYLGFPKRYSCNSARSLADGECLIATSLLQPLLGEEGFRQSFHALISTCSAECLSVHIRLHPKERHKPDVLQFLEDLNVHPDDRPIDEALRNSSLVLGSQSSVLVEAAFSGIPSFQVKELDPQWRLERTDVIEVSEFGVLRSKWQSWRERHPGAENSAEFEAGLQALIEDQR